MEWRGGIHRRSAAVVAALAACLLPALPANAHNGEHPVSIASAEAVGPYHLSAWTSEGFSNGTIPIAVHITGSEAQNVLAVKLRLDDGSTVSLSPPNVASPFAWTGVTQVSGGHRTAVIEVIDAGGSYQSSPLGFQVAVAGWGLAILLGLFAVQAIAFFVWLLGRTIRVWSRQPVTVSR
ncbi:MAG: hypothetical protein ACRDWA_03900 [Acidimicrobiia bacterium]